MPSLFSTQGAVPKTSKIVKANRPGTVDEDDSDNLTVTGESKEQSKRRAGARLPG